MTLLERYLEMQEKALAGDEFAKALLQEGLFELVKFVTFEHNGWAMEILVAFDIPYREGIEEWKKVVEEKNLIYYEPSYKPQTPEEEDAKIRYYSAKDIFVIRHRSKWQIAIDTGIEKPV